MAVEGVSAEVGDDGEVLGAVEFVFLGSSRSLSLLLGVSLLGSMAEILLPEAEAVVGKLVPGCDHQHSHSC